MFESKTTTKPHQIQKEKDFREKNRFKNIKMNLLLRLARLLDRCYLFGLFGRLRCVWRKQNNKNRKKFFNQKNQNTKKTNEKEKTKQGKFQK